MLGFMNGVPARNPEKDEDDRLAIRAGQGERGAFDDLTRRHYGRALGLARRLLPNPAEAEEAVQEAFLKAWNVSGKFNPEAGHFRAWFNRILVNLCIDEQRRQRGAEELDESLADPAGNTAVMQLQQNDLSRIIGAEMNQLPPRQKAALVLCYFEGLSNREAADTIGVSVGALESLLIRARSTLKSRLAVIGFDGLSLN